MIVGFSLPGAASIRLPENLSCSGPISYGAPLRKAGVPASLRAGSGRRRAGFVGLPPFLEQRPLIDAVNFDWSIREAPKPTFSGTGIATLWCPSDVGSWCRLRELPRIGRRSPRSPRP